MVLPSEHHETVSMVRFTLQLIILCKYQICAGLALEGRWLITG